MDGFHSITIRLCDENNAVVEELTVREDLNPSDDSPKEYAESGGYPAEFAHLIANVAIKWLPYQSWLVYFLSDVIENITTHAVVDLEGNDSRCKFLEAVARFARANEPGR